MKILHVITSLKTGGAEKLMVDLLPRLRDQGEDVELLVFDGTPTAFMEEISKSGIKVYNLGVGGSVYSPLRLIKLIPFLKKYDIIHAHNTASQLFVAIGSLLCSVKLCTTEHNTSNRRRKWGWYRIVDKWMYNRYHRIICISDKTEKFLRDHIGSVKPEICTIYNGIDIKKYAEADIGDLKKIDKGCRLALIQVAGFRSQKDQDTVIKSLKSLPDDIHLFLVGDGDRRKILSKLVEDLELIDRVHFLGIRTDIASLLKASDIVIMSSHWEGFGLAAVEGMAAGKPVIASDVDGLREVINDAGILFPQGNAISLASEILRLDFDPKYREKISNMSKIRASEYDITKMAEGYDAIYRSLKK